jgi:hypothetical protein
VADNEAYDAAAAVGVCAHRFSTPVATTVRRVAAGRRPTVSNTSGPPGSGTHTVLKPNSSSSAAASPASAGSP